MEKVASLLEFVKEREETAKSISEEIKKINESLGYTGWNFFHTYNINEHSMKRYYDEIKKILSEENGHIKLLEYYHKELLNIQDGIFIDLYKKIKKEKNFLPEKEKDSINEFLSYLKKLVGSFHQLIKMVTKVERLEGDEEAGFAYLYTLLNVPEPKIQNPTEIQKTISKLEAEFNI